MSKTELFILKERACAHQKEVISYFKHKPLSFLPIHFISIVLFEMVIKHNFAPGA